MECIRPSDVSGADADKNSDEGTCPDADVGAFPGCNATADAGGARCVSKCEEREVAEAKAAAALISSDGDGLAGNCEPTGEIAAHPTT